MNGRIVVDLPRVVRRRLERDSRRTRDAALRTRVQIVLLYDRGWGALRIATARGCVPAPRCESCIGSWSVARKD